MKAQGGKEERLDTKEGRGEKERERERERERRCRIIIYIKVERRTDEYWLFEVVVDNARG